MTTAPLIQTQKFSKSFAAGGVQQHVLKNLDLEIAEGDFTVIMGPSGAGKSTLMYCLSGMDSPTLGEVFFQGEEISRYSPDKLAVFRRRRCGFIFQQVHLLDSMSVMDNALAVGLLLNRDRAAVRARADELFDLVGLDEDARRKPPNLLSGGEAQRAALVRALINEPAAVFADEPTGQLNSEYGKLVLDLLTRINESGQSVIMVTHDVKSALRGTRILYIKDGTVRGELDLGRYAESDTDRPERLTAFLSDMGW